MRMARRRLCQNETSFGLWTILTSFAGSIGIIGIALIVMGIYTFTRPLSALTGLVLIYGLVATAMGIVDIVFYVKTEEHTGFAPTIALISGILSLLAGLMLMIHPGAGRWALVVFFPLWFIAHCISRLSGLSFVRMTAGRAIYWLTLIINVLGLMLGILMLVKPAFSLFSVMVTIGCYLILLGIDNVISAFSRIGSRW